MSERGNTQSATPRLCFSLPEREQAANRNNQDNHPITPLSEKWVFNVFVTFEVQFPFRSSI